MAVLIDYIWQTTFSVLFFYGVFWFLLRKEKSFNATRVYLLVTPIIALICPLVNIPVEFEKPGISLNQTDFFRALSEQEAPEVFVATYGLPEVTVESTRLPILLEIKDYLLLAYLIVAALIAAKVIWGFFQVRNLKRLGWYQSSYDIKNDCHVVPTFGRSPIFSFFNNLFWDNTAPLAREEQEMIYGHEVAHIRQKHSWDVVYFQILTIIFWFNPTIHLMRRAIIELHEYLADHEILKQNNKPHAYLQLIAAQAIRGLEFPIGSHFAKSLTLSRIQMIKKQKRANSLRVFLAIPISFLLIGVVSLQAPREVPQLPDRLTSTIDLVKHKLLSSKDSLTIGIKMTRINDPTHFEYISQLAGAKVVAQIGVFEYEFEGIKTEEDYRKVRKLIDQLRQNSLLPADEEILRPQVNVDQQAQFPGQPGAWEEFLLDNISLPEWELSMGLGGVIEIEFIVDKHGRVIDPIIKKSIGGGLEAQLLSALSLPDVPRWRPAYLENEPVNSVQSVSLGIYPNSYQ